MLTVRNLPSEPTVANWLRDNRDTLAVCTARALALLGLRVIAGREAIAELYRALSVVP